MKAVILAGGLGTRMGAACEQIPKPMLEIDGKPVLLHQIEALKKEGVSQFILVVCHKWETIKDFFGDGSSFGVEISYFYEEAPLGTAGALFKLGLKEDFLLLNGDLIFDFSLSKMEAFHRSRNALATLLVHPNSHPQDSTLICADKNGVVTELTAPQHITDKNANLCNAGIQIVSRKLLELCRINGRANFDRDVIKPHLFTNRIYAYKSSEYVHDMGTPQRLNAVERDLKSGVVQSLNQEKKQKAVFLDRDGTLNVDRPFINDPEQIELLPNVAQAISQLNRMGYLTVIITNQPVVARGECTLEKLEQVHNRLEMLLGKEGAFVNGIYFCPHHPHSGFEGEVKELKISCQCRKPRPKMIFDAQRDFNIDLEKSYMLGDRETDVLCGKNAGCVPVLLSEQHSADGTLTFKSVSDFVDYLLTKSN